uniref:Uncharacterized protein n=1 Tax=Mesocestoides corti TaxID=53468 RepID=A0A5K3EZN0_MESCO
MGHYTVRCGVRGVSNWIFYQHWMSTTVQGTKPEAEDSFTPEGETVWRRIKAQTYWTTWPQTMLCFYAFQWHARMVSSQLETDISDEQYILGGMAKVVDSDGWRLTCCSGL